MGAVREKSSSHSGTMDPLSPPSAIYTIGQNAARRVNLKRKRNNDAEPELPPSPVKSCHRNGAGPMTTPNSKKVTDLTSNGQLPDSSKGKARSPRSKTTSSPSKPTPERRARMFRSHPSKSFQQRLQRAITQRMFVVSQNTAGTDEAPEMIFDIVGTTGNLYKVDIRKEPTCDCPDARKGNQCKHICYVLVKVLKAPTHLQYQLAFLSAELREIYENSPLRLGMTQSDEQTDGKRKPVEGDCPICFMEFEPDKEDIVWCRAACGNNIHKTCFQKWAITQRQQGVRCVYCRSAWQTDNGNEIVEMDLEELLRDADVGEDGYLNVAEQMGLSGERDCSTYYRPWVHRRSYSGWRDPDWYDGLR